MAMDQGTASGRKAIGEEFSKKPALALLQLVFPIVSKISERAAASLALSLFLTPPRYKTPQWERPLLHSARSEQIRCGNTVVNVFTWGTGNKKILLCHSWGGRATQLGAFVEPLVQLGFQVIGFDAPAHGSSPGRRTDMIEYSTVVGEIIRLKSGVHGILGHSFGAGNALFAKHRYGFKVDKIVLVGCFSHGIWITEQFGKVLRIPARVIARMRAILEKRYPESLDWEKLDISEMSQNERSAKILFVHDKDDREIPYFHAEMLLKRSPVGTDLHTTNGLGHRRILRDPVVVRRVCEFFLEASP